MPLNQRRANITWTGNLIVGSGKLRVGSNAFPEQTVTFSARTEKQEGTTPEELISGALATCYVMVLANILKQAGNPSEQLDVEAVTSLDRIEGGLKITDIALTVKGNVPGFEPAQFDEMARTAEQKCPVANALRGNVNISVSASLAS
ncbi:MAG: OsmC family peroxiredoxin [Dehalococcoidia bacterium]